MDGRATCLICAATISSAVERRPPCHGDLAEYVCTNSAQAAQPLNNAGRPLWSNSKIDSFTPFKVMKLLKWLLRVLFPKSACSVHCMQRPRTSLTARLHPQNSCQPIMMLRCLLDATDTECLLWPQLYMPHMRVLQPAIHHYDRIRNRLQDTHHAETMHLMQLSHF